MFDELPITKSFIIFSNIVYYNVTCMRSSLLDTVYLLERFVGLISLCKDILHIVFFIIGHCSVITIFTLRCVMTGNVICFEDCYSFIAEETHWFIFCNCKKIFQVHSKLKGRHSESIVRILVTILELKYFTNKRNKHELWYTFKNIPNNAICP